MKYLLEKGSCNTEYILLFPSEFDCNLQELLNLAYKFNLLLLFHLKVLIGNLIETIFLNKASIFKLFLFFLENINQHFTLVVEFTYEDTKRTADYP